MDYKEFEARCQQFGFAPPKNFYPKYQELFDHPDIDDLFLFLKDMVVLEGIYRSQRLPDQPRELFVGRNFELTLCSVIQYIRDFYNKDYHKEQVWWATLLAEQMARKMSDKLQEYKSNEKL